MAYDPRRTLVVGLCVLSVALAASLFPAAGVGTHPGGDVGGAPGGSGSGDVSTPTDDSGTSAPAVTTAEGTEESATETPPPPDTPTATQTPGSGADGGGDDGSLLGLLAAAVKAVAAMLGLLLVLGLLLGLLGVFKAVEPGAREVELPWGLTLPLPFAVPAWLATLSTRLSRVTMAYVVGLSASVSKLLGAVGRAARGTAGGLAIVGGETLRGTLRALAVAPRVLVAGVGGLATFGGALASLSGALGHLRSGVGSGGRTDPPTADARAVGPDPDPVADDGAAGPRTVEEAWLAMVELAPVPRRPSTTPAEFARAAVDRGLPAGPVERLTRAFQEVAYGGVGPTEERRSRAREAYDRIRGYLGGDG